MIIILIYSLIAAIVFLSLMHVDKSSAASIKFDVPVPLPRETVFLFLGILWPVVLFTITSIKWNVEKDE